MTAGKDCRGHRRARSGNRRSCARHHAHPGRLRRRLRAEQRADSWFSAPWGERDRSAANCAVDADAIEPDSGVRPRSGDGRLVSRGGSSVQVVLAAPTTPISSSARSTDVACRRIGLANVSRTTRAKAADSRGRQPGPGADLGISLQTVGGRSRRCSARGSSPRSSTGTASTT